MSYIRMIIVSLMLVLPLAACSGGNTSPVVNFDEAYTCPTDIESKADICHAMAHDQITISAKLSADDAKVLNARGETLGALSRGDSVRVVCFTADGNLPQLGVLMSSVAHTTSVDPDRFATGAVDGENFTPVGFTLVKDVNGGNELDKKLVEKLDKRFANLRPYTCDDTRVAVDSVDHHLMTE